MKYFSKDPNLIVVHLTSDAWFKTDDEYNILQAVFIGHDKKTPWSVLDNNFEDKFQHQMMGAEITQAEFEKALSNHKNIQKKRNERIID